MLKDLQERIDEKAGNNAEKAGKEFWEKHGGNPRIHHTVEGIPTPELAKALETIECSNGKSMADHLGVKNGAHINAILSNYCEILKAAVYVSEKARLEAELVELAGRLYDGEIEPKE